MGWTLLLFDAADDAISEFADKLLTWIIKTFYDTFYGIVEKSLQGLFDTLNNQFSSASRLITKGPRLWNGSAYETVQAVAENVCIPIAGAFITVIFCWELIHLVQESNSMQNMKPERLLIILMKFGLCIFVCAYSFKIVMGFCDIGIWAARALREESNTILSISTAPTLEDLGVEAVPTNGYTLGGFMTLAGYLIILNIARLATWICGILVYISVMMWFIEFLVYAGMAPVPYSTWVNREWSQVGMNYTRKMLALSFDGFFKLLLFALYGGVLGGLELGDFKQSLVMIIGCGFALAVMLFKTSTISASIFNAH